MTPHEKAIVKACSASDSVAPWVGDYAEGAISAYIAAMRVQGWVMAPVEPTDAMIAAGAAEVRLGTDEKWSPEVTASEVYDAMLAAKEGRP